MLSKNKIKELQTWLEGDEKKLTEFYQDMGTNGGNNLALFWSKKQKDDVIKNHYGRPQQIVDEIKKLIFPNITYKVTKKDKEKVINEMINSDYWKSFVKQAIVDLSSTEVAYGYISYLGSDEETNPTGETMVFLENLNPLKVEEFKIKNKIMGFDVWETKEISTIKSKDIEEQFKKTYQLRVRHTHGKIEYKLFDESKQKEITESELKYLEYKIPENTEFANKNFLSIIQVTISKGVLRPNLRHFDAQDEVFSQQRNETRKNKRKTIIANAKAIKDSKGKVLGVNDMDYEMVVGETSMSEDGKPIPPSVSTKGVDIDPEKRYLSQQRASDEIIVQNAGLDVASFKPSINAESGKSKQEQYKRTLQTYADYTSSLKPFFTKVLNSYLGIVDATTKPESTNIVEINFEEYIKPTLEDRIKTYGSTEAQATLSIERRVRGVMPNDATDEDIKKEIKLVKEQEGVGSNPFEEEIEA